MKRIIFIAIGIIAVIAGALFACGGPEPPPPAAAPSAKILTYAIDTSYPHDTSSFTEGLLIYKNALYESTGEKGKSKLLKYELPSLKPVKSMDLDTQYFGEGIVILHDTIYQLTYQEKVGFMYTMDFKKIKEFTFASEEGWGMTTDGKQIIASDGSSNLYFYEPGTFRLVRTLAVTEVGSPVSNINELEFIDGYIYANKWQQSYILKIDPSNGDVVAKADIADLWNRVKAKYPQADVPNGIAYDSTTKKMYITGKKWPELYEIKLGQ